MDGGPAVHEVHGRAGAALIFTEAATHGTLPWRGSHQRRALLYKFIPSFMSYAPGPGSGANYPSWMESMTEAQQAVLLAPSYNRPAVGDQAYAKL